MSIFFELLASVGDYGDKTQPLDDSTDHAKILLLELGWLSIRNLVEPNFQELSL